MIKYMMAVPKLCYANSIRITKILLQFIVLVYFSLSGFNLKKKINIIGLLIGLSYFATNRNTVYKNNFYLLCFIFFLSTSSCYCTHMIAISYY